MTTVVPFSEDFITQYQDAFEELVRLGTLGAQNKVLGKDSKKEDEKAQKLLTVLQALSSPGHTEDNIESLEYCLVSLNESLAGPTAETLLPLSPAHAEFYPVRYSMYLQEVSFIVALNIVLEPAEYTATPQNVDFIVVVSGIHAYTMTLEPAEYTVDMQDVTFTYEDAVLPLSAEMLSAFLNQTFRIAFGPLVHDRISLTGDPLGDSDTNEADYATSMDTVVTKLTNGGIALDFGNIIFRKNGVDQDTQNFVLGQNLNSPTISYNFTGLVPDDALSVYIAEG